MRDTRKVDHGTVTYLEKMDLLKGNLLAAHTVWVNDSEVITVADSALHSIETKSFHVISAFTIISTRIMSSVSIFIPYLYFRLNFFVGFFPQ